MGCGCGCGGLGLASSCSSGVCRGKVNGTNGAAKPMGGAYTPGVMRPVAFGGAMRAAFAPRPSPWARAPSVPIATAATAAASFLSGEAKPYGAVPTPPELTAAQWAALTPEQQAAFLKADSDTKKLIADGITTGAKAAVDLIIAGINAADAAANRANATEIEKIRAANDLAKAKIAATTQIELAKLGQLPTPTVPGGGLTALTGAPASWIASGGNAATWAAQTDATRAQWLAAHEGAAAAPSSGISGTTLAIGGLALGGLAYVAFSGGGKSNGGGGRRRRRRR